MTQKDGSAEKKRGPPRRYRRPYRRKYSRVVRHIDWYLQKTISNLPGEKWPSQEIETALAGETGIEISWDKIHRYNTQQFLRFDTSPLLRVSESEYAVNEHYYALMSERVAEPGKAKRGRPRKSYQP